MKIYVESQGNYNNFISLNKFKFSQIPYLTFQNYFINSKENYYFLFLSILQLCTYSEINLLPSHWSPSGPFTTFIPLFLCFMLEFFSITVSYFYDLYKTYKYNYFNYVSYLDKDKVLQKNISKIKIGDLLFIEKNSIFPVDGLIFKSNKKYGKVSLSNLNGECDIIVKKSLSDLISDHINSVEIINIEKNKNSIKKYNSIAILNNKQFKINHKYFVPGGTINKGDGVFFIITEIGTEIRSYNNNDDDKLFEVNFLNKYVSKSLTNYFVPVLFLLCFTLVFLFYNKNTNIGLLQLIEKFTQSWILLNGIVPFSIKIILMVNRNLQSLIYSNLNVEFISPMSIDNFPKIQKIICDKTGTLTKNELSLTHVSYKNSIFENYLINIPINVLIKIALSLHCIDKNYHSEEDKIIGEKLESMGLIIEHLEHKININYQDINYTYQILEMDKLKFDCIRKLSSVILKDLSKNEIFIITKGAINSIKELLLETDLFLNVKKNYDLIYPFLRTLGFCFKEIKDYNCNLDPKLYEKERTYNFLSIVGIKDLFQNNIVETIKILKNKNKKISICTGDRKETAVYISESLNLVQNKFFESNFNNYSSIDTFLFSSDDVKKSQENYMYFKNFEKKILECNNFVGYSLIPNDKKFVSSIFESNSIKTVCVGDGNNDIPMFRNATVSISINNGSNTNVVSNSLISIKKFENLQHVINATYNCRKINLNTIYAVFFKTLFFNLSIFIFIIYNNLDFTNLLFTFFEIQGHHMIWGYLPIFFGNFNKNNSYKFDEKNILTITSLSTILSSIISFYLGHYINFYDFKGIYLFLTILVFNIQFIIIYGFNKLNIFGLLINFLLVFLYVFSSRNVIPKSFS